MISWRRFSCGDLPSTSGAALSAFLGDQRSLRPWLREPQSMAVRPPLDGDPLCLLADPQPPQLDRNGITNSISKRATMRAEYSAAHPESDGVVLCDQSRRHSPRQNVPHAGVAWRDNVPVQTKRDCNDEKMSRKRDPRSASFLPFKMRGFFFASPNTPAEFSFCLPLQSFWTCPDIFTLHH